MEMIARSVRFFLNRFSDWLPISWLAERNSDENVGEILFETFSTKPQKIYRKKKKKVGGGASERIQVWVCQDPC
jgi:hypothetical protein